jgi:hypothetical protein
MSVGCGFHKTGTKCTGGKLGKMLFRNSAFLGLFLLLLIVAESGAAPTINNSYHVNSDCAALVVPVADAESSHAAKIVPPSEFSDYYAIISAANDFLKPQTDYAVHKSLSGEQARSLPVVPQKLPLVLAGFLCVSLANNRKGWRAVFSGMLLVGLMGVQFVPQVALRLSHITKGKQRFSAQSPCRPFNHQAFFDMPQSRREGTQYIGLLRCLAGIPDSSGISKNTRLCQLQVARDSVSLWGKVLPCQPTHKLHTADGIISAQGSVNSLSKCLALEVRQCAYFSPAFAFSNLARGPPIHS